MSTDTEPPSTPTEAPDRLLGAHMPTAGGIHNSLTSGKQIGCSAVQLFTGSPRQWHHPPLDPEVAARFRQTQADTGIAFTVAHDSYLINLAAPDSEILDRSRKAFRRELERADALGIPWVVTHMGASLDSPEENALGLLCESLNVILRETDGMGAGVALETTAGQGTTLGYTFEQIARVVEGCGNDPRIGVCLDTCHIFVAGYDIRDEAGYAETFDKFGSVVGFDKLKVIHANDAKKPLGSRVDRHEHLGDGEIGIGAFQRLLTDSRMLHVPVVVETPDAETMHAVNVGRLRRMAAGGRLGMRVTVRVFGHYKDFADEPVDLELPTGARIEEAAARLAAVDARLDGIARHCRAAINEEYVAAGATLHEGDELAFIPPMSGG